MDFFELLASSFEALTLNKMRTALAGLGIVIGIGAVIALVSLGQATQQSVQNSIQGLGANLLTISPGSQRTGAVQGGFGSSQTLTLDDANAIQSAKFASVSKVSPEVSRRSQVTAGRNNTNTSIIGATANYLEVHNVAISSGTFITDQDVQGTRNVAVIGPQVVSDLFGGGDPTGQTIRINKIPFTIIGITVSKGGTGFANQDDIVFIPITTAQKTVFGIDYVSSIALSAASADSITQAENDAGYLLLQRHKISDPTQADFSMFSQSDILSAASSVTGTFTALLAGIAAISLLVGGIGIMNIMLVTVIERTREIGLRKALGAKDNLVIAQFLIESIILTIGGGLTGMVLGILLSYGISLLINLPFTISIFAIFLAIGVSGAIGILFGWYPAKKAADLSPIEALRYE
ncbi:MAG TPA: ABC transporter permease [Patescibacteria group bacterium]|jgi:putative ABC transport system permease protein|nr:ABC transporter permease [Patescibacteria group bacterium]